MSQKDLDFGGFIEFFSRHVIDSAQICLLMISQFRAKSVALIVIFVRFVRCCTRSMIATLFLPCFQSFVCVFASWTALPLLSLFTRCPLATLSFRLTTSHFQLSFLFTKICNNFVNVVLMYCLQYCLTSF